MKSVAVLEPDVPVLYGLWDEQSERFFDRRLATQESSTVIFSDSPCEELPMAHHMSKVMLRQGADP